MTKSLRILITHPLQLALLSYKFESNQTIMKKSPTQINPIVPRANAKLVTVNNTRHYLIGGMTADKVTNDIYEMRSVDQDGVLKVEWRPLKFKNNVFKPRNSYSACGSTHGKFYIWGGLESGQEQQKCLSDLIEVDTEKCQMKLLPLKQPIKIHSASLHYDAQQNQLLAIGGTNDMSTMESQLYILKLDPDNEGVYEWKKLRLDSQKHKGYLWQHTSHLSNLSYFTGSAGKYLTVIGGCHYPQSPYPSIVEFDLKQMKATNTVTLKYGLVSHDSVSDERRITIFGGATGGDFNNNIIVLEHGKVQYQKGYNAVGCAVAQDDKAYYIIGGVCGPESLNSVIIEAKKEPINAKQKQEQN